MQDRSPRPWRLLLDPPSDGATNMARDEALLIAVGNGAPPALRLYDWTPPCLSLGAFQDISAVDRSACAALDIDLVRRPSGGAALLHQHEVTYAVIAPLSNPLAAGTIRNSYRRLAALLHAALQHLGAPLDPPTAFPAGTSTFGSAASGSAGSLSAPRGRGVPPARRRRSLTSLPPQRRTRPHRPPTGPGEEPQSGPGGTGVLARGGRAGAGALRGPACFATTSAYELTAGGRKLAGSAQVRRGGALLQHGSILLDFDPDLHARLLPRSPGLAARVTTLRELLGRRPDPSEVAAAFRTAFSTCGIDFEADVYTPEEEALLAGLLEKYRSAAWTLRPRPLRDSML
jgi:lipoate-protein ligase A